MDQIDEIVSSINRISNNSLDEEQLSLIDRLLRFSSWYPDRKDHAYVYKLYKEMKISAEAEMRLWEEKFNYTNDTKIMYKIAKCQQFLDEIEIVIQKYASAFNTLMESYSDDKSKAFYLIYFKGRTPKDVAHDLPWLAIGTVNNWKSQFQKDLDNIDLDL